MTSTVVVLSAHVGGQVKFNTAPLGLRLDGFDKFTNSPIIIRSSTRSAIVFTILIELWVNSNEFLTIEQFRQ